jgi:peroxiredoxin family protein
MDEVENSKIEEATEPKEAKNPKETDFEDLAKVEITKATISQAIGTLIYPLTSELATAQVKGINKLKLYMKNRNKQKLAEKNKEKIDQIIEEAQENDEKLIAIEKLHKLMESASNKELENDGIINLWSSLINKIKAGDSDADLLISKLESLSTAEAEFLIEFKLGKHKFVNVNSALSAISFRSKFKPDHERFQTLALALKEKDILTQPFPVVRAIFGALFPILLFLVTAELYRDMFSELAINVSSANNVILIGVFGVMLGLSFLPFLRQQTRLTWIGDKLCEGLTKLNKPEI